MYLEHASVERYRKEDRRSEVFGQKKLLLVLYLIGAELSSRKAWMERYLAELIRVIQNKLLAVCEMVRRPLFRYF